MPRFFVRQNQISDGIVNIVGDDAHHISRSLRMAAGEHITVSDMQKNEYECVLSGFSDGLVTAQIISQRQADTEPCFTAHLYQALPKGEKLDYIIQKAVECGVSEVTTFESERCIAKEKDPDGKKLSRRQRISLEAAKQSGRGIVPQINATVTYEKMLELAEKSDIVLFCYEGDGTLPLGQALSDKLADFENKNPSIAIIIGSEGGFSIKEADRARERGFSLIGLGKRILRTETASGFVLSCLVYEFEL
ncbi:MAG: 16S rRNA (uracil(1498)-N(3))-methyltransferase [Clostridia bacterium]|nr:16S rRNA (uracil(1498)-N(3))-methyltransferase [Clostridia bacterium]